MYVKWLYFKPDTRRGENHREGKGREGKEERERRRGKGGGI